MADTKFKLGNKAAEKWTESEVENILSDMRENAKSDQDILCLQDAIMSVDLYRTSLDYLLDKFPVFGNIKSDIQDIIVSRVNKGTLKGTFNATGGIWRMKQLGEKDTQYQDIKSDNNTNLNINPIEWKD